MHFNTGSCVVRNINVILQVQWCNSLVLGQSSRTNFPCPAFTTPSQSFSFSTLLFLSFASDFIYMCWMALISSGFHTAQFPANRSGLPAPEFLNGMESASSTVVMGYDAHSKAVRLSENGRVGLHPCLGMCPPPTSSRHRHLLSLWKETDTMPFPWKLAKDEKGPVNSVDLDPCYF